MHGKGWVGGKEGVTWSDMISRWYHAIKEWYQEGSQGSSLIYSGTLISNKSKEIPMYVWIIVCYNSALDYSVRMPSAYGVCKASYI